MEKFAIAALIMGLAGSLHCVGMCGPLISAMPYNRTSRWKFARTKFINHLGRLTTYTVMGLAFGLLGQGMAAAGFQQWVSIISGVLILLFIFWPARWKFFSRGKLTGFVARLKQTFSQMLEKRNPSTLFILGMLNGLLPCGLVYFALAASLATGNALQGGMFMFLFGVGTTPALVAIGILATGFKQHFAMKFQKAMRVMLIITALILIARGSNLGIPYLSPKFEKATQEVDCCHRK